ncbi:MAG: Copper-exporting P-type ATPase A [candidate division WS6 bacterium OLB20]|uniref:Copper-exporting P-type ATPase A n=1 Tax=candidate division WS6 bacterium OLB20 TaxID=1617426 RepID=A0A136LWW4_9BACT|nr:MAG: Copper-exporting P-type ATPase A [candidate division WS6 bacterium OLB20]
MSQTKQIYPIVGMHCASCKLLIEKMVGKLSGVTSVNVNYATEKMTVEYDSGLVSVDDIRSAVAKAVATGWLMITACRCLPHLLRRQRGRHIRITVIPVDTIMQQC